MGVAAAETTTSSGVTASITAGLGYNIPLGGVAAFAPSSTKPCSSFGTSGFCPIPSTYKTTNRLSNVTLSFDNNDDNTDDKFARTSQLRLTTLEQGRRRLLLEQQQQRQHKRVSGLIPGAEYLSEMKVPILGKQVFKLLITGSNTARLSIQGRIFHLQDQPVQFQYQDDQLTFDLPHATQRLLQRFGTRLGHVAYNEQKDEARLKVQAPLPFIITLHFKRSA